jgi:hypothetical protein
VFQTILGEEKKRIRAVAICVGAFREGEMILVGRKLASDFSD